MIIFDKVSKKYPLGNIALNEASFEIENNEFVFLVGSSGAGKTTILKMILREILPSQGTIMINDFDITSHKFNQTVKLRQTIGTVFQDFKILPEKNVFENIAIGMKVLEKHSYKEIKDQVRQVLKLVNLPEKELVFPIQLSAGELQRVAIARTIIGNRQIILADEPTGNLDPKTAWEIMKIFKRLEGKRTIIFATHNSDIVSSMQKRVIILKNGKITKDQRKGEYHL